MSERQMLQVAKMAFEAYYHSTGDSWYAQMATRIDEKLQPILKREGRQ